MVLDAHDCWEWTGDRDGEFKLYEYGDARLRLQPFYDYENRGRVRAVLELPGAEPVTLNSVDEFAKVMSEHELPWYRWG